MWRHASMLLPFLVATVACHADPPPPSQPLLAPSVRPPPMRPSVVAPSPRPEPSLPPEQLALRPNFLVVDIDSMRADRLGMQRDGRPIAPRLEALAHTGVRFDAMIAQSGWTFPSVAALLSGRIPPAPAMARRSSITLFEPGARTLPEILGSYGYTTAVFWGWTIPVTQPELSRGFQYIGDESIREASAYRAPVVDWIQAHATEPFFLLVHNMDLHYPHPPYPLASETETPTYNLDDLYEGLGRALPKSEARQEVIDRYDAGLAFYDGVLGSYLDALDQAGLGRRTIVVITSDHGESLFEHDRLGHGHTHYDEVIRVPMVWSDPMVAPTVVSDRIVQTIDLVPSILARADLPAEAGLPGQSILPLLGLSENPWSEREAFSMSSTTAASLRSPTHCLLLYPSLPGAPSKAGKGPPRQEITVLYDIVADPAENRDVSREQAEVFTRMKSTLMARIEERRRASQILPVVPDNELLRKTLQERGYWENVQPSGSASKP